MEDFEFRGYWWLPDDPDYRVAGFLSFSSQSGAKLELTGTFRKRSDMSSTYHPLILGQRADSKLVTLQYCNRTNYTVYDFFSTTTSDYAVRNVFIGINVGTEEALKFTKVRAKFTYLYNWIDLTGIKPIVKQEENSKKLEITYSQPENVSAITNQGKIDFIVSADYKTHFNISNLHEKATIQIECNEEKDLFSILQDLVHPFQSMLDLGTTKANFIEELILFHKNSPSYHWISVHFPQSHYKPKIKENLFLDEMIFTLSDIYDNLEDRINNWFSATKELDSVFNLFHQGTAASDRFLELKFLSFAQAVETYHGRRKYSKVLPPEQHEVKMKEILGNVPEEHKKWLKAALAFSNSKSLLIRLDELVNDSIAVMDPILADKEVFTKTVKNTRNYYTHYSQELRKKALRGYDLHFLTERLSILLQSCLMIELGISPEQQIELLARNNHYRFLANRKNTQ